MSTLSVLNKLSFKILLFLFVGIVMIDPANNLFHMKEFAFFMLMAYTFVFQRMKIYKDVIMSFLALLFLAFLSISFGNFFFQSDISTSLSYFKALLFLFVVLPLSRLTVAEILKLNYMIGLVMSSFVAILLLAYVGGFFNLEKLIMILSDANAVYIAKRDNFGIEMWMFFYATMPFLFLSLIYALRNCHIISALIILAPIFFGGSRSPMLMALVVIGYILYKKNNKFLKFFLGTSICLTVIYAVSFFISDSYIQEGDEIKIKVAKYLFDNSSIIPHGVGVLYRDPGRNAFTTTTEVTYFEMLYQYGWILFPFVIYIFIRPFFLMYRRRIDENVRDFAIAYLLYLFNAGTNPLLISSTGMYVFACALTITAKVYEHQTQNRNSKIQAFIQ